MAPIACPKEIPPPYGFTLLRSKPNSFSTATEEAAKASLISNKSISATVFSCAVNNSVTALIGATPIIAGSIPTSLNPQISVR